MSLTAKQAAFCREYLTDLNASAAAVRAGYSAKTAGAIGHENLRKPEIATEIERLQSERAERTALTADWVVCKIRDEAEDRSEESSQSGRLKALELLGKHLGLFVERLEHSGPSGGPIPVEEVVVRTRSEAAAFASIPQAN